MKKKLLIFTFLFIFLLTRLLYLNSGLNVIEPDEQDYQEIAFSAAKGWPLYWQGKPYFEKFPLFIYLGFGVGKLAPWLFELGPYVNLRIISVLSSLGLSILFFEFLKKRIGISAAFISLLFLLLNPLFLFYSRQGTFEAFFLFFGFLFFFFFDRFYKKLNYKRALFLGFLLGLAMLAKHINSLLFILPAYHFFVNLRRKKPKSSPSKFFWIGALGGVVTLLALLPVYLYSKDLISEQYVGILGQFFIRNPKTFIAILWEFLKLSPYWQSWPIFIGGGMGVLIGLIKFKRNINVLLVLVIGALYINSYYITPRSYIFILPYFMIMFANVIDKLGKINMGKALIAVMLFITLIQAKVAFDSTRHQGLKRMLDKTQELLSIESQPVYATFEQDKLAQISGLDIKLLTYGATQSGIILTDERKSELMLSLTEPEWQKAKETIEWIKANQKPVFNIKDPYPHFPGSNKGNQFSIYLY